MDESTTDNTTTSPISTPELAFEPELVTTPVPEPIIDSIVPSVTPEPVSTPETTVPATDEPNSSNLITDLTQSWALVRDSDGLVETFLRLDLPPGWTPPEGFSLVPDDKLPEGWGKIPQSSPVPETVTATQMRLWLVNRGFTMAQIYEVIGQIPDPLLKAQTEVQWEYAPYVERNHPMINTLGAALGLDGGQIDDAFREASLL